MDDAWYSYFINDLENMEYRIEDIILHSFTGFLAAFLIKLKSISKKLKQFLTRKK